MRSKSFWALVVCAFVSQFFIAFRGNPYVDGIFWGAIAGMLVAIIPYLVARYKNFEQWKDCSFFICLICGAIGGLLLSGFVGVILAIVLAFMKATPVEEEKEPARSMVESLKEAKEMA